jgi:hypothetical protein
MKRGILAAALILLFRPLFGAEYNDGYIRLVLNPQIGRFSLYRLVDTDRQRYEALFMDQDPRTSVLTLSCNGKTYRLGEAPEFTVREGGSPQVPALIFESSFAAVTAEFSFITTGNSDAANGIKVAFRIENKTRRRMQAGLRLLLDTKLGESTVIPFTTSNRSIGEETIFGDSSREGFWVSGLPEELSLMGSIAAGVDRAPDRIHIANWKRLNDVPWYLDFVQGRKFNNPPYSIRDSALAYYYEPVRINRGESDSFYLLLASGDPRGFASIRPSEGVQPAFSEPLVEFPDPGLVVSPDMNPAIVRSDYYALQDIINRIDGYLEYGVPMSDDEAAGIEQDLDRIRSRYTGP